MRTMRIQILVASFASAIVLVHTSPALADESASVTLTFEKCFAGLGPAPYLFHFTGSFGGDLSGQLLTGVLVREDIDKQHQIIHLEADYAFTADDGNHSFTAHVEGNENLHTAKAVLNGVVISGAFEGAQVHVEFVVVGGGCFDGTIRIAPDSDD